MRVPTIGLIITDLVRAWTIPQWRGVVDAARDRGVNLLIFAGRQLQSPYAFDAQANGIYDRAASEDIDGLVVWTAGLVNYVSDAEVKEMFARYARVPVVSVEEPVSGVPCVQMDDFGAMRSILEHLIDVHGCRRIAYVLHATPQHFGFKERYRAFRETLAAHDIGIDPALISPCIEAEAPPRPGILSGWMSAGRVSGWDAIVGHNDLAALQVHRELRALDADAFHRIALVGFDDLEESAALTPPLTTVRPPFREMGRIAVDLLLDRIAGKTVPAETTLRGELVIRRSCGCADPAVAAAAAGTTPGAHAHGASSTLRIRSAAAAAIARHFAPGDRLAGTERREALLADFFDEVDGVGPNRFIQNLERFFAGSADGGFESAELQTWISILRREASPLLGGERLRRAENLLQQARVVISAATARQQAHVALQVAERSGVLRDMEASMISTFSVPDLMTELTDALPRLGIHGCFLALSEDSQPDESSRGVPDSSRLMLALEPRGTIHLHAGGQAFPSRQIIPPDLWPRREPISLIAEPLFFRESRLGYVLFELGPRDGALYESLRAVISSALQGALLVRRGEEQTRQLQMIEDERRRLESMLHQSQKMEAVGQLAGGVAHEYNNILAVIMGYCSVLLDISTGADPQARDMLDNILTACRRASDLAQRMLVFADRQGSNPLLGDLNEIVQANGKVLSSVIGEKCSLRLEPWKERVHVLVDRDQIDQVLLNLATNARDAMPDGGTVLVRVTCDQLGATGETPAAQAGQYAHLCFSDTGTGMDAGTQARLFEPFFTTKEIGKGTGLGLPVVWGIVARHRGFITVKSEFGKGTTFDVFFPIAPGSTRTSRGHRRDPARTTQRDSLYRRTRSGFEGPGAARTGRARVHPYRGSEWSGGSGAIPEAVGIRRPRPSGHRNAAAERLGSRAGDAQMQARDEDRLPGRFCAGPFRP